MKRKPEIIYESFRTYLAARKKGILFLLQGKWKYGYLTFRCIVM